MLDTDTCIYAMSAAPGFQPALPLRDCAISVVVLGELEFGVLRSQQIQRNRAALDHWLIAVQVLDMSLDVGLRYGKIRAELTTNGQLIGQQHVDRCSCAVARRAVDQPQLARVQASAGPVG